MEPNHRRCISCRQIAPKDAFWRIVRVYSSHQVQLDKGMGRSAYLCTQTTCLSAAQKKNRLGKALKASVPKEIYQTLWQRLSASSSDNQPQPGSDHPHQDQLSAPELHHRVSATIVEVLNPKQPD
jgi:predicted RNA-binding protein YlxR (DUF448 family)